MYILCTLGRVDLVILFFIIVAVFNGLVGIIARLRSQSRKQPKFISTCNIDPTGIALFTADPIAQKKVYKPDKVKFSFESMASPSSSIKIKLTLRAGSETERLRIDYADKSLANEIARILNLSIPFPPSSYKQYDIYDDDAWNVGYLRFYFNTQTIEISVGRQSGWNVSVDFERTVRLQDIADVQREIIGGTSYRFILVLQSGEQLILLDDSDGSARTEQTTANVEKKVEAEVAN